MCANKIRPKMPSETRKVRKPLMEKKRRARINDCLEELKRMLLQNKKECLPENRPSKLEKADILEQTVDFLRRMTEVGAYCRGYRDAQERIKCLVDNYENLPPQDKQRLTFYLFTPSENLPSPVNTTNQHPKKVKEQRNRKVWRPW